MNTLVSLEPPNGDFAAYIDAIVGPPPEDPETAAREISEQLALRSKDNIEIMNAISPSHNQSGRDSSETTFVRRGPLSTGGGMLPGLAATSRAPGAGTQLDGLPDIAATLQAATQRGQSSIRRLMSTLARFAIFAGGIWIVAALVLANELPGLSPVPGIVMLFLGFILSNASSSK